MWTGRSVLVTVILSHLPSVQQCFGEGLGYPHQDKQSGFSQTLHAPTARKGMVFTTFPV